MLLNQDQDLLADLSIAICSSYKCVGGPTSQGCLFIRKCTRFDVATTIVYSVLSFEFWALVSGLEQKRGSRGRFSNHCQMSPWKDTEKKGV